MLDMEHAREQMVRNQIVRRGVTDDKVLQGVRAVPRELFVDPGFEEFAYEDAPLPIGEGQTISQPFVVALMIEAVELEPGEKALEVGAGSGYAAAVMSRIAREVHAIERHRPLADEARKRFAKLGYDNIHLRVGDGTKGLADEAPFDAIVVSAGGESVPQPLKDQLELGGRLIIPVRRNGGQRLIRITRIGAAMFEEEDLGSVSFVPLVHDPASEGHAASQARPFKPARFPARPVEKMISDAAEPLPDPGSDAFGQAFDRFGDRRVVLLGEASHGTSEFYRARAAITRHLIEKRGFDIVAVEADWPDAAAVDRFVRDRPAPSDAQPPFQRFPTWMWRNAEMADFVDWLRAYNDALDAPGKKVAFHGLDLYAMKTAIAAVLTYLDRVDPDAAKAARERYGCLTPWQRDPAAYGRAVLASGYAKCEEAVVQQCRSLLENELKYAEMDGDVFLDAAQNARLVAAAERYYRVMYYGGAESWNLRDGHMFETLKNVLDARGAKSKAVVWAHNSHIGDARHTEMGKARGEFNIGQLCREHFGEDQVALIGFGTHTGTVAAASNWDGDMEVMRIRPSHPDSYERVCHDSGNPRFLLDLKRDQVLARRLEESRLERFIGVIYRPESERLSHYAEASLPQQFDAFVWFDETRAITPLGPERHRPAGVPETYPFGV